MNAKTILNRIFLVGFVTVAFAVSSVHAQAPGPNRPAPNTGVTIQLPSIGVFGVRTVVSVPDGGTMRLGGNSGYAAGRTSRGVPLLSGVPYLNRPFRNQGIGRDSFSRNATTSAQIIIMEELEKDVMAEARARQSARRAHDPNGSRAIQKKADFISRNIGRRSKR